METNTHTDADATSSFAAAVDGAKGKMGNMQEQLADFLDNAAESLRKQSESMTPADSGPDFGGTLSAVAPQIASSEAAVAGMLAGSASWLRENDLSDMEARITKQVQEHPVRTLAIAAAVGFLISRK